MTPPPTYLPVPEPYLCVKKPDGTPDPAVLCLSVVDMNAWADNTERAVSYVNSAWARCGKSVTP